MARTRPDPIEVARIFVDAQFPHVLAALVAGSVLRGEGTSTSDLDVVILSSGSGLPYRESFRASGWPIETFVHTLKSWRVYLAHDVERRMPSLASMTAEGVVLRDRDGLATLIKQEAQSVLAQGPPPTGDEEMRRLRYGLTNLLDDFLGSDRFDECMILAGMLAEAATDLVTAQMNQWTGRGTWVLRALRRADADLAAGLSVALEIHGARGDKHALIAFTRSALDLAGGPLFEGYYSAGRPE